MIQTEHYEQARRLLKDCAYMLEDMIRSMQGQPFVSRNSLAVLQDIRNQLYEHGRQFEYALRSYQEEYDAYYAGSRENNIPLSRSADRLEDAERHMAACTAECVRKLIELVRADPKLRRTDRIPVLSERFSSMNRAFTQMLADGTDHGEQRPVSREPEQAVPQLSRVQFSAIAPKEFTPGEYMILNIVMYEDSFRHIVQEIIEEYDEKTQEAKSGVLKVGNGSAIRIVLTSPDYAVEDNEEEGIWNGEYLNLSFVLTIPEDLPKKQVLYVAQVYINEILSARLKFAVRRSAAAVQKPELEREDYTSAFISYASEDRKRVAGIIQGMKKARPDLDIFFDVESIRSGANWKDILYEEIRRRDILYLCWSRYARESRWVDEEWRYALKHHGPDHIDIVPLDQPELCSPPAELRDKNFNEKLLYIINSNLSK